jgi:hypothetical protein
MKIKVFFATDGDCLLLTSDDGKHVLVDGGRKGSFDECTMPVLTDIHSAGEPIDLVVVSHVDDDHLAGISRLVKTYQDWVRHEFAIAEDDGDPPPRKPAGDRPPDLNEVWHNSWRLQVGDDVANRIANYVEAFAAGLELAAEKDLPAADLDENQQRAFDAILKLGEGIPSAMTLQELIEREPSPIKRNTGFRDKIVKLRREPHERPIGNLTLTVLGPSQAQLDGLKDEWEKVLDQHDQRATAARAARRGDGQQESLTLGTEADLLSLTTAEEGAAMWSVTDLIDSANDIILAEEIGNEKTITIENLASIIVLAQDDSLSCLLPGDAASSNILEGLRAADNATTEDEPFVCDVLKVQHHGAEFNVSEEFTRSVLANHYVFCANGRHHNPDPLVVRAIVSGRAAQSEDAFTLWFNCTADRASNPDLMQEALDAAVEAASAVNADQPNSVEVRVLDADEPFYEICDCADKDSCNCQSGKTHSIL